MAIQHLAIDQYQQEQHDHPLFPVRLVARYWGHGGYDWSTVTNDGELLCQSCTRENYGQIVRSTLTAAGDGWQIVGFTNSGELEDGETCAHCYRQLDIDA